MTAPTTAKKIVGTALSAALMASLPVLPVHSGKIDVFANLAPVEDNELGELRGGFSFAGLDISFGVSLQSLINGVPVLNQSFNLDNPATPQVIQIGSPATTQIVSTILTDTAIANTLITNQVNNTSIVHHVTLDIVLSNFPHFQANMAVASNTRALGDMVAQGLVGALR